MNNLYRIMIVDDERLVREAIASSIEWENYGIEVVFSAGNALEALDFIDNNEVDLMLIDIRMPVIDGIELLKRVQSVAVAIMEEDPELKQEKNLTLAKAIEKKFNKRIEI